MTEIKVFGEDAKQIKEGDVFIAHKTSVEGRDVVILKQKRKRPYRVPNRASKYQRIYKSDI